MGLFRRHRRAGEDTVGRRVVVSDDLTFEETEEFDSLAESDPVETAPAETEAADPAPEGYDRATDGPYDSTEVDDLGGRIDLGAVRLAAAGGAELSIEIDPGSQEVQAVTLALAGSAMQLQAFAAPRTSGLWREIRREIADSVTERGGAVEEQQGPFGTELLTRLPARGADGRTVYQVMRFIGVDGPRWFLRAVLTGPAGAEAAAAEPFYAMIRNSVVVRGGEAMPPREMLQLRLPKEIFDEPAAEGSRSAADLNPFERGPEITEVR